MFFKGWSVAVKGGCSRNYSRGDLHVKCCPIHREGEEKPSDTGPILTVEEMDDAVLACETCKRGIGNDSMGFGHGDGKTSGRAILGLNFVV